MFAPPARSKQMNGNPAGALLDVADVVDGVRQVLDVIGQRHRLRVRLARAEHCAEDRRRDDRGRAA